MLLNFIGEIEIQQLMKSQNSQLIYRYFWMLMLYDIFREQLTKKGVLLPLKHILMIRKIENWNTTMYIFWCMYIENL